MEIPERIDTEEAKIEAVKIERQLGEGWTYMGCLKLHPSSRYDENYTCMIAPVWIKSIIWLVNRKWFGLLWWLSIILIIVSATLLGVGELLLLETALIIFLPACVLLLCHYYVSIVSW